MQAMDVLTIRTPNCGRLRIQQIFVLRQNPALADGLNSVESPELRQFIRLRKGK